MTVLGFKTLEDEQKKLKYKDRPDVIKAIAEAREHGDLSENAEYHAAKELQSFIERRITELEDKIRRSDVIDVSNIKNDKIVFGATIELFDKKSEKELTYQIVGIDEANVEKGLISHGDRLPATWMPPRPSLTLPTLPLPIYLVI